MRYFLLGASLSLLLLACKNDEPCSYIHDYYQLVHLAHEAYYKQEYQKVVDLLDQAGSNCQLLNQTGIYEKYKYAIAAARIGENEKALRLIRELVLQGYEISKLAEDNAFAHLLNSPEWKNIEANYDALHEQYMRGINLDLRRQIGEMRNVDQSYRYMLQQAGVNRDSILQILRVVDSINDVKFKQIISTYGYPGEDKIGGYKIDQQHIDAGILLFHFSDYDYYTTTLKELIDKGDAPPESLGNFVDSYQRRVPEQKKFLYGIYDNVGEDQIIDYEHLDERRVSIGLPPMDLKKSIEDLVTEYYGF